MARGKRKKAKKFKRSKYLGLILAVFIICSVQGFYTYNRLTNGIKTNVRAEIFFDVIILSPIIFVVVYIIKKNHNNFPPLREVLQKVLKTQEDYTLLDDEVYGTLKRNVSIGNNNFVFTPHFLIQKIDEKNFNYKVIKLQDVSTIKFTGNNNSK